MQPAGTGVVGSTRRTNVVGLVDRLGGPTPDGAGWLGLHGIQLDGVGAATVVEPHRVVVRQAGSAGQVLGVLVAVVVAGGAAAFLLAVGAWPMAVPFGLLAVLPLLAFGHGHELEFTRQDVFERRRNLFVRRSARHWTWEGVTARRALSGGDVAPRHQVLVRVSDGWLVAAWSSPTADPAERLDTALKGVTAG
jgi:hypothetical protein